MLTRRQLLKRGAVGGAVLMAPSGLLTRPELAQARALKKFRTACPTPGGSWPVIDLRAGGATTLNLKQFKVRSTRRSGRPRSGAMSPAAGPARRRSTYLGPTLVAQRGNPVDVTYNNQLPTVPLFPADPALVPPGRDDSRINTHLHGGAHRRHRGRQSRSTPTRAGSRQEVPPGGSQTMTYANEQGGTLLWYHDHALGITRTNVYAGLAGGYLLTDPGVAGVGNVPTAFDASDVPDPYAAGQHPAAHPAGDPGQDLRRRRAAHLSVPLGAGVLRGQLPGQRQGVPVPRGAAPQVPVHLPERLAEPLLQPRPDSTARRAAPPITQIGVELGPLDSPVPISSILIAPAERADVIIDFAQPADRHRRSSSATRRCRRAS